MEAGKGDRPLRAGAPRRQIAAGGFTRNEKFVNKRSIRACEPENRDKLLVAGEGRLRI